MIAGVEVSTDSGASWHPATGDETWTYSWIAPACRHLYDHLPRGRRQHQSGNALRPDARSPSRAELHNSVPGLGHPAHREHDRCERSRARGEIPILGGRHRQRASGSTRATRTPAPIPARCGRAPARSWRPSPSPTSQRAAGRRATFSSPVDDDAGHDLYGLLSHQCRPLLGNGNYFTSPM